MNTQLDIIDTLFGLNVLKQTEAQARESGISAAETSAPDMDEMRKWARFYVYSNQSMRDIGIPNVVFADAVRKEFKIRTLAGPGNAFMGSVFRKHFVWTGEFLSSKTEGSHARLVKLWTLPSFIRVQDTNSSSVSVP